jgi:hypothetical protein
MDSIVGLASVKEQIATFKRDRELDDLRRQQGRKVPHETRFHMVFYGSPGTGKTRMGRLMAQLLFELGITPTDTLVEVQRGDLVASHIGQTAQKTAKVIESAKSGVLFVDEAYQLAGRGERDFGPEAIEQLMSVLNDPPGAAPVVIFAGYKEQMRTFMLTNDGIQRRINPACHFIFANYSCEELAQIFMLRTRANGFNFELAATEVTIAAEIRSRIDESTRSMTNAGLGEIIFGLAKSELNRRECTSANPSCTFLLADIQYACDGVPSVQSSQGSHHIGQQRPC